MSSYEFVTLPLTGAGDSTKKVAVDTLGDGSVVQLFKLLVSADGVATFVPADIDGVFVQSVERVENPHDQLLIASALGAGANVDLDCADVTTAKTGRLIAVDIGGSVPLRCDIQTVTPSRVTRTSIYTLPGESVTWRPPSQMQIEIAGGSGKRFGVSLTNLSAYKAADGRATVYWDEV